MTASHPEAALSAREAEKTAAVKAAILPELSITEAVMTSPQRLDDLKAARIARVAVAALDRLSTAHTATAGDGRAMDADDLAQVISEAVGDMNEGEPLTAGQWRYVAQRALNALAQAPAVQAPAGWKLVPVEPTEEMLDAYWAQTGESNAMRERTHDFARTRYARMIAASPTPTDAQPTDARPVGDEALREARQFMSRAASTAAEQSMDIDQEDVAHSLANWEALVQELASRLTSHPTTGQETVAQGALVAMPVDHKRCFVYCGDGICTCQDHPLLPLEIEALGSNAGIASSHAGQETVETPRDGGVREALARVNARAEADSYEFRADEGDYTPTEHERAMLEDFGNGLIARVEEEFAALSAPGSAGPGERERDPVWLGDQLRKLISQGHVCACTLSGEFEGTAQGYCEICDKHPPEPTPSPAQEPGTGDTGEGLTLMALHEANIARQAEWCPDQVPDLSFRGNELAGETGEACNVIKKLERERQGWRGTRATLNDLAEELADVVICADLCAVTAGIDLSAAVVAKFNATSDKVGISVRLPTPATTAETRGPADREGL